jgi:PAS domain S-box-containing protein
MQEQDITELRETQEALRQANACIDVAVRGSNICIWGCDMPDGQIEKGHPTLINMWESLGYDAGTAPSDFPSVFALLVHPDDQERVNREIHVLFASDGQDYESEYRVRTKDGSTRWHLARGTVVRDAEGKPVRFIGTSADITALKRAQETLRERERQLGSLLGHLPGLAYRALADDHWTALFVSKGVEDLTGYPPEEFTSHRVHYADIMLPEDLPATREAIFTALRERRMYEVEHRIRHKDGSVRWIWARGHGVFAPDGSLRFIEGLNLDMTSRKRAEEGMRASEERYRGTFENAAVGIAHRDARGNFLRINEKFCAIVGYSREELLQRTVQDITHPNDLAASSDAFTALWQGESPTFGLEKRYVRKDGSLVWGELFVSLQRDAAGQPAYDISIINDISERKRLEEELRDSEERFRGTFENALVGIAHRDTRGHFLCVNEKFCAIVGYSREELLQMTFHDITHPDDLAASVEMFGGMVRGDSPGYATEKRYLRKDGSPIWIELFASLQRDAAGQPAYDISIINDISKRKRLEEELRDSEERRRLILDNANDAFVAMSGDGLISGWNHQAEITFGWPRAEAVGRVLSETIIPPQFRDAHTRGVARFLATGEGPLLNRVTEVRALRRDGSEFPVEISIAPVSLREHYLFAAFIRDVTERKRAEEELRRAKEAAEAASRAKDEFLANVSHEIRTPMNAILGMAELTLDTPLTEVQRGNLNIVLASAEGLLTLINDLLDFSKIEAGRIELEQFDFSLRALLNQTLRALALRAHKKSLELACQVDADVPDGLVGDGHRLRQVLLNLIGNAIKFTEAGEVVLRVHAREAEEQDVTLEFEIADTGIGIPPDKQQKIFGAFEQVDSSTSRRYGGTGLGLTISSRLVEMMGGNITVESEVDRGSKFRFGAHVGRSSRLPAAPARPAVVDLHGVRVLIVDDNATNRVILKGWASGWGMLPTAAHDVPAAMSALWRGIASKEPFALVLLDVRMPGTDGLELAKVISQTPELDACCVILLTSDDRPVDAGRYRALRLSAVLMKPVQQEELFDHVYRVLSHGIMRAAAPEPAHATPIVAAAREPVTQHMRSRPLNVLVAEDNRFNQTVIQQMVERGGHAVRVVENGGAALAALEQDTFDVLLLDVNMPDMDGFAVIKTIREQEKGTAKHLRVVALTALSGKRDRERCLEAGMDDYLAKPVRAAELNAALERATAAQPAAEYEAAARDTSTTLVDAATLLSACAGDAALLSKMIRLFEEEAPRLLNRIEAAVQYADAAQLRLAAHTLRGIVSAFSTSLNEAAEVLEQMGTERRAAEADEEFQILRRGVADLSRSLATLTIEKLRSLI